MARRWPDRRLGPCHESVVLVCAGQDSAWGPVDILLAVVGFIEALLAIATAALCCVAVCCRARQSDAAVCNSRSAPYIALADLGVFLEGCDFRNPSEQS